MLHVVKSNPRLLWLGPLAWALLLFAASALPGTAYPEVPVAFADKLVHVSIYGVFGALLAGAARANTGWTGTRVWAFAIAVATLYGASDEVHQMFVPTRSPDVRDLIADTLGAALGGAISLAASAALAKRRLRTKDPVAHNLPIKRNVNP